MSNLQDLKPMIMENQTTQDDNQKQTIIVNQPEKRSNGLGTAGFVLSLIALFFGWIPLLGWLLWFLGILFSFIAVFKAPRGLAIAGLIISLLGIILLLTVFIGLAAIGTAV